MHYQITELHTLTVSVKQGTPTAFTLLLQKTSFFLGLANINLQQNGNLLHIFNNYLKLLLCIYCHTFCFQVVNIVILTLSPRYTASARARNVTN